MLALLLCKLLKVSLAMGYIPSGCKGARVCSMSTKPVRVQHDSGKDFRPISLTSFVLKLLERLLDRYINTFAAL